MRAQNGNKQTLYQLALFHGLFIAVQLINSYFASFCGYNFAKNRQNTETRAKLLMSLLATVGNCDAIPNMMIDHVPCNHKAVTDFGAFLEL